MKCISVIRRLFFFNLLSLLWWPYFCDIRQDDKGPEGLLCHEDNNDLNRITNVPTKQKEINHANLGVKNFKENIVQSSVEFVNNELKAENNIEASKDVKIIPEVKENIQIESSLPEIKKSTLSNIDSNARTNMKNKEEATVSRHVTKKENVESSSVLPTQVDKAPQTTGPQVTSTLSQPKPAPGAKVDTGSQQPDQQSTVPKKSSLEEPVIEVKEIKPDSNVKNDLPTPAVAVVAESGSGAHSQYEGMPSFDEWKKMMLAEQEKGGQKVPSPSPPGKKISSQKRRRNYSSYECGAKIVASNPEAEGTNRILNELVDEYMLNPCKAKIWFVIELCETVQTSQIELANFELFSSCPKDLTVYSSDNFPTRDWVTLGTFTAAEQRVLQSFELKQEGFGKFIKIELSSHYGKEHYCPLSVVRIFGTSMVDEYEEMETLASQPDVPDDDLDRLDIPIEDQGTTNIFGSATDAVMNIVKKAAQALGQHQPLEEKENNKTSEQLNTSEAKLCKLLSVDNKCEGSDAKNETYSTIAKIINFTIPLSSAQRSLFRHLHRCDQCLSSPLGYYSSAQPQCRFFQAALGPIMFKALCDWFKEHPLVIPHEVPTSTGHIVNGVMSDSTLTITATKSPPPQIMRLPLQDISPYTTMAHSNTSKAVQHDMDTTVTVEISNISGFRLNKTVDPNRVKSQIIIDPSKTVKISNGMDNDTQSMSEQTTQILQKIESVTEEPSKSSEYNPQEVEPTSTKTLPEETVSVHTASDDSPEASKKPKDEIDQLSEILLETTTMSPEDLVTTESMLGSEFSSGFKVDERILDGRGDSQGKDSSSAPGIMVSASAGQKESVFIRMGNRIKALEINMSLSSLYLQELSQRYRRQMEDMQRTFNRTIGTLNDTAKKAAEKDLKQQEIINNLQSQVENLTKAVELLMSGRSSVFRETIETHVCLMVVEAIIMITIMSLCVRRISSARPCPQPTSTGSPMSPRLNKRRNSADSNASPPIARKVKRRSCSEEALVSGEHVLNAEPITVLAPNQKVKKKNKKRHRGLQHSTSQPTMQPNPFSSPDYPKEPHQDHCSGKPLLVQLRPTCTVHHGAHSCENCHSGAANCTAHPGDKEKRSHAEPLRNLTNGRIEMVGNCSDKTKLQNKDKEKFSLRKFLQFQKRDSI